MKPFDDHFADNVREAFDHYHEEVDPGAFADLQQRLQQRKRRRVIALLPGKAWVGMAASVLLVATGWLLLQNMPPADELAQPQVVRPVAEQPLPQPQEPATAAVDEMEVATPAQPPEKKPVAAVGSPAIGEVAVREVAVREKTHAPRTDDAEAPDQQQAELLAAPPEDRLPGVVLPALGAQGYPPAAAFMAAGHKKGHSWSIAAGSMLAYARQGISDGLGVAAGVVSEWQLAPGITLTAGGLLTYHQFELVSPRSSDDFYAQVPGEEFQGDMMVKGSSRYELLALDIPLNAQLDIARNDKRRLYLGAGLSSILFLQEHFRDEGILYSGHLVLDPQSGQMVSEVTSQRLSLEQKTNAFSRFDAARLFNVSFGYVIQGRRGATIIEPFLKVPLGSITSRELHLGMGGITLRYNFQKR